MKSVVLEVWKGVLELILYNGGGSYDYFMPSGMLYGFLKLSVLDIWNQCRLTLGLKVAALTLSPMER